MTDLDPALTRSVTALAEAMAGEAADWWIIGSAAMALCGIAVAAKDVDVTGSAAIMARVSERLGGAVIGSGPSELFRSEPFAMARPEGGLPIELMGDLHVSRRGMWRRLLPRTRLPVIVGAQTVFVPTLVEQIEILNLFGRDKDKARAALIAEALKGREGLEG